MKLLRGMTQAVSKSLQLSRARSARYFRATSEPSAAVHFARCIRTESRPGRRNRAWALAAGHDTTFRKKREPGARQREQLDMQLSNCATARAIREAWIWTENSKAAGRGCVEQGCAEPGCEETGCAKLGCAELG